MERKEEAKVPHFREMYNQKKSGYSPDHHQPEFPQQSFEIAPMYLEDDAPPTPLGLIFATLCMFFTSVLMIILGLVYFNSYQDSITGSTFVMLGILVIPPGLYFAWRAVKMMKQGTPIERRNMLGN